MFFLKRKTRGAVTIFLTLILVPCIVVTCLFVDAGRISVSKSMATSAADLALDSLLTNYDADLSEWYGMVASCQSIDEFYETSAEYFLRTISSQGLSDDEIKTISDYYADATNDDSIYDLLKIDCQTETSAMITEVDGANLTNATFIKEQVLEFMKYRAPIEIVSGLVSRLTADSSTTGASEAEDNEELVEKKQDFYESEGKLNSAAYKTYCAIYDYYEKTYSYGMTLTKLQSYLTRLNRFEDDYELINQAMIYSLYNTEGLTTYTRVTKSLNAYISDSGCVYTSSNVYSTKSNGTYYITDTDATDLLDALAEAADAFKQAIDDFVYAAENTSEGYNLYEQYPGKDNQVYQVQWWVRMNTAVVTSGKTAAVQAAAETMLKAYARVENMQSCTLDSETWSSWDEFLLDYVYTNSSGTVEYEGYEDSLKEKVKSLQSKYLTAGASNGTDHYQVLVTMLEQISSNYKSYIDASTLTMTFKDVDSTNTTYEMTKTISQEIIYIHDSLASMRSELKTYVNLLNIAIDGDEDAGVGSIDNLITLLQEYNTNLQAWSDEANTSDEGMKGEDQTEISKLEAKIADAMTEESLRALKERLVNIRAQYQQMIDAIDSMQYGTQKVKNITGYSNSSVNFKDAASGVVQTSSIPLMVDELQQYSFDTFTSLYSSNAGSISVSTDNNSNPVINPKTGSVDTPEMFVKWYQLFGEPDDEVESKVDEAEEDEEDAKNKADEEEEAAKSASYDSGGSDISRDFSAEGTSFSFLRASLSGVMTVVESLVNLDFTDMRDDLYVTTYIMEMFSYETFENEGYYSLLSDTEQKALTLGSYESKYESKKGAESTAGTWLSTATTDTYNKSLTNKMINLTNNAAYGAEVEYILYGGTNTENLKSATGTVYGIRYALNLVSGFANFWTGTSATAGVIEAVSDAVAIATAGIVPAPVVKAVLIAVLTAFETSTDMKRLKAGFPVELYKTTADDWWCGFDTDGTSISAAVNSLGNVDGIKNTDTGIFYSDYLWVFVYLGLTDSSSAEGMYQRMAEVIQANMWNILGQNSSSSGSDSSSSKFSMKKARLYFKLEATIRVEPLMITIPLFTQYDTSLQSNTDWCTYSISLMRGY